MSDYVCEVCGAKTDKVVVPWDNATPMCVSKGLGAWRGHSWRCVDEVGSLQVNRDTEREER